MTVKELIEQLQKLPQNAPVVVYQNSEYTKATKADIVQLFDNGGYMSHPYRKQDEALTVTCVDITD